MKETPAIKPEKPMYWEFNHCRRCEGKLKYKYLFFGEKVCKNKDCKGEQPLKSSNHIKDFLEYWEKNSTRSNLTWVGSILDTRSKPMPLELKGARFIFNMVIESYDAGDNDNAIALLELLKVNIDKSIEKIKHSKSSEFLDKQIKADLFHDEENHTIKVNIPKI